MEQPIVAFRDQKITKKIYPNRFQDRENKVSQMGQGQGTSEFLGDTNSLILCESTW